MIKKSALIPAGALLLSLAIASCTVDQHYSRPDVPLPAQFARQSTADTASIAQLHWKEYYTDATLQGLIEKGLQHNYNLQIALRNIDVAHEQALQARALMAPRVDLQVTGQITRPSDNSLNGITAQSFLGKSYIEDYNANVALSWEADIWGKLRMQKQAALAQYLQTAEVTRAIQTRLISDIAQGYYMLLMLDEQLAIANRNLKLADTTLLLTRLQRDAGNTTTLAVEQAQAQRQATAILIPQLEQNITIQEHALNILTGELPGTIVRSARLSEMQLPAEARTGVPTAMLGRRPDVHAAELGLIAANRQTGVAKANMYPSLNITAQGGLNSFKSSNWFNIPASLFGLAAGGVVQPLIEHRALKTRYRIAQQQREQAVLAFRQSVLGAVVEVSDALVREEKLTQQQDISASRAETLHKAVSDAQLLFRSDMASYLEVITAQSAALQADLDLASIRRQRLNASVDLYRALGGGKE